MNKVFGGMTREVSLSAGEISALMDAIEVYMGSPEKTDSGVRTLGRVYAELEHLEFYDKNHLVVS